MWLYHLVKLRIAYAVRAERKSITGSIVFIRLPWLEHARDLDSHLCGYGNGKHLQRGSQLLRSL
jgi:hypothetical protein